MGGLSAALPAAGGTCRGAHTHVYYPTAASPRPHILAAPTHPHTHTPRPRLPACAPARLQVNGVAIYHRRQTAGDTEAGMGGEFMVGAGGPQGVGAGFTSPN